MVFPARSDEGRAAGTGFVLRKSLSVFPNHNTDCGGRQRLPAGAAAAESELSPLSATRQTRHKPGRYVICAVSESVSAGHRRQQQRLVSWHGRRWRQSSLAVKRKGKLVSARPPLTEELSVHWLQDGRVAHWLQGSCSADVSACHAVIMNV